MFSTAFCGVVTALRRFRFTYICFDPRHRTVVVASIEILLGQQILEMAYFRPYYYYCLLLPIMKIYNPEQTCCYAWPATVTINSNIGLKCWPCRGPTLSDYYQTFFIEHADTTTFTWILDISQFKTACNKTFRHEYYYQSSQDLCDHIFKSWYIKGWFRRCGFLLV